MASITTRSGKGSPLTHAEVDANFTNLNTDKLDVAGIALGTAASPTVKFTGDPNTGIYSPGADQVAISTNGNGRLFISSAGLVGIGTSSPSNTAGFSQQLQLSGNLPCISIDNTGTGANKYSLGVNGVGALGLWDNTASAFRVYINSSGSVGFGTTSPSALLTAGVAYGGTPNAQTVAVIQSATNTYVTVGAGSSSQGGILFADTAANNAGGVLYSHSTDSLEFLAGGNEAARIDSSRRLLVGTTSNSGGALLQVNGDRIRVATAKTPASATDTGTAGEICWDANYIYVCTATNTWKRTAIATW